MTVEQTHQRGPQSPGARGRLDKREAILNTASRVFLDEGNPAASVADIARKAGVAKPTLYAHFGSKETLLLAVLQQLLDRVSAANYAALNALPDRPDDLESRLVDFARQLVHTRYRDLDTTRLRHLLHTEVTRYPRLVSAWRAYGPDQLADTLAGRLARLAYAGYLTIDDPDRAARQFLALVRYDGELLYDRETHTLDDDELTRVLTANVRMFLRAYTPQ